MGHNYVGTEHILLALLEQEDGAGVLTNLGIDKATAETGIAEALTHIANARTRRPDRSSPSGVCAARAGAGHPVPACARRPVTVAPYTASIRAVLRKSSKIRGPIRFIT